MQPRRRSARADGAGGEGRGDGYDPGGQRQTHRAVGDCNSPAGDGPVVECAAPGPYPGNPPIFFDCLTPYEILTLAGYTDTWDVRGGPWDGGDTCCQADLLDNEVSELDERIDLIFVLPVPDHYGGPVARGVSAEILGEEPRGQVIDRPLAFGPCRRGRAHDDTGPEVDRIAVSRIETKRRGARRRPSCYRSIFPADSP